jgi:hypothetical protein
MERRAAVLQSKRQTDKRRRAVRDPRLVNSIEVSAGRDEGRGCLDAAVERGGHERRGVLLGE